MSNDRLIENVRAALAAVPNPLTSRSIVADGLVHGLDADIEGVVRFALETNMGAAAAEAVLEAAKQAAAAVPGVRRVSAVATSHRATPVADSRHPSGSGAKPRIEQAAASLAGVRHVVAVASGKGGVGKSTVAANLAAALARRSLAVGLMDADIYGPSLPMLFGLTERPPMRGAKIAPIEAFGVKAMSIGLLVDPDKALAWRGPMVMSAVRQLMGDVDWGELDLLLIDTPPGTGDAHLSLAQSKRLSGVVIVSTPQELALADVRRGVELFRKVGVAVLGVLENMAWLETASGERQYLFGKGGAERAAKELGAPFLGALPFFPELREASDQGRPLAAAEPSSRVGRAFEVLASKIADQLKI
jgi:ATP-binding protein involved in chromosome partitioning